MLKKFLHKLVLTKPEDSQARGEETKTKPNITEEEEFSEVGPICQEHAANPCKNKESG
jgi:hypothetical protein